MRQFCTLFLVFGLFSNIFAQNNAPNFWKPVSPESIVLPETVQRTLQPLVSETFQLDYEAIKSALKQAPMEFTPSARQAPVLLVLPQADGALRSFRIWESPVMAPELSAKFPEHKTYAGSATDGSGDFVRLGTGPLGFQAFIFSADGHGIQSVRPYANGQHSFYSAYRLKDLPNELAGGLVCGTTDIAAMPDFSHNGNNHFVTDRGNAIVQLKKYRIAIAARGEYTNFYGSQSSALDAIKTALNFIVGIQERDFAVRMELIMNNNLIVFPDPNTDPYSGETVGDWMNQNPAAINPILGVTSYDVGHVFSRYIVGDQVGVVSGRVCNDQTKARGASSASNTDTEYFYLVAAHEIGHQLSGSHTWNNCPPIDNQIAPGVAFEPGSGSTVMSYAGSCSNNNNVQGDNDPYYHIATILQVKSFVEQGEGSGCGTTMDTGNSFPEVTIPTPPNNTYIPVLTPFQLTGTATDADGDPLSYCWEQYDLGPSSQLGDPIGDAPSFRSYPPTTSPTRYFPRYQSVLNNSSSIVEVLPDTSRTLTFRLTVRDNHAGGGGTAWKQVKLFSTFNAGPFRVSYPNTSSVVWNVGEYQTVTWDVANTDKSPVNCKKVNILMSTNGGTTFNIPLATGVPNIGRCCVQVPNNVSSTVRIRIEAADNVFYDLSNLNFKIQQPTAPAFSFCPQSLKDAACLPANYTTTISTSGVVGFNTPITLSATGLPAGAVATFSPNPVAPGSTSTLTVDFPSNASEGSFDLTVNATAGGNTQSAVLNITVTNNDFSALALELPVNGAQSVDLGPVLYWNGVPDANQYAIEVATNPSFAVGTILSSNAAWSLDSFKIPLLLNEGQICYWRVRPINECGEGDWTEPFVFVTKVQSCASFAAADLPKNISTSNTALAQSQISISNGGPVGDVNVKKVQGSHQSMNELEVNLISPAGTSVQLFKQKCGSYSGNFNIGFDDSAGSGFACPPNTGNAFQPAQPLSALNGQNSTGTWTLQAKDNVSGSGGQLTAFELELCSNVALNAPFIVNNNLMQVMGGSNAPVTSDLLKADDPDNGPNELVFTLLTVPQNGILQGISGTPYKPGDSFTQSELNNNWVRYFDYGINAGNDSFRFAVTDGEGGLVAGTFIIQPFPLDANEPFGSIAFGLAPNPANETVRLFVSQTLDADSRVTLFDAAGRQIRSWSFTAGSTSLLLNITDLPEGIYAVAVENEKGRGVKKLVVK